MILIPNSILKKPLPANFYSPDTVYVPEKILYHLLHWILFCLPPLLYAAVSAHPT